nr:hypothetical protein [uncultured Butyrivibrio sp.]
MAREIGYFLGGILVYLYIGFWIINILGGLVLLCVSHLLCLFGDVISGGVAGSESRDTSSEDVFYNDENMYTCTDEWRRLHPYGLNPVTGGWNAEEDEANGW